MKLNYEIQHYVGQDAGRSMITLDQIILCPRLLLQLTFPWCLGSACQIDPDVFLHCVFIEG
jgi:hypothetical protein